MKIALIGKGPSWAAYRFGKGVVTGSVNGVAGRSGELGGGGWFPVTTPEHIAELVELSPPASCFFASVMVCRDVRKRAVKGHTAPRILRGFLANPTWTRIYLQGFDLSEPQYACQLREFAKIARIPGARDRIIVTTPGPLDKFFPCRAPDPEDLADVG